MGGKSDVTIVCATFNARRAVRLTLASFRRHTPEPCTVIVADNGSTDGTLEDLQAVPWLTLISLEERRALSPPGARRDPDFVRHGATLDWLIARVRTPYVLTLDSDVELLRTGWLSEMVTLMDKGGLTALGEYEPGFPLDGAPDDAGTGYRPRLAPHVLMMRTEPFRRLGLSFRGFSCTESDADTKQWLELSARRCLSPEDLEGFSTLAIYDTGAWLLERLRQANARWMSTPEEIRRAYRHLGHMSTAPLDGVQTPHGSAVQAAYTRHAEYVQERLRHYPQA